MNWDEIVLRVAPSIVKIETPGGHGTGFFCFYNEDKNLCGIATAHHVVEHADDWQEPIRIMHLSSKTTQFVKDVDRVIWTERSKDSAVIVTNISDLQLPESPIPLLPIERRLPIGVEVGWLGYPALAEYTLCFFSGNISAWQEWRNAYLVDGVAINVMSCLYPVYVRGEAYMAARQGSAAAAEFQKILDHSGIVWNCWTGALARL